MSAIKVLRWVVALVVAISVLTTATATASAASPARVAAGVSPGTAHIGSSAVVSGVVSPGRAGVAVRLERKAGHGWVGLGHGRTVAAGRFSISVATPRKATVWQLRAVAGAAVSAVMRLRVVTAIFAVRVKAVASVASGVPIVVTGAVSRKASGTVTLQSYQGKSWRTLAAARLSKTSAFRLTSLRPAGSYRVRVVKPATATTAPGVSATMTVTIAAAATPDQPTPPALAALSVTTTTLPAGLVTGEYTASLEAAGGVPPYTWRVVSGAITAGLALSSAGALTGAPTAAGLVSFTVAVGDAAGQQSSTSLTISTTVSPFGQDTVESWGANDSGQLGNGSTTAGPIPKTIPGLTGVIAVSGSGTNGYALRFDGTVWSWGDNTYGGLGDGSTSASSVPVQVIGLSDITAIAATWDGGYALRSDGTLWSWGENQFGGLGNGNVTNSDLPVQVIGLSRVTAVAAGAARAYALESDGTVWSWGTDADDDNVLVDTDLTFDVPVQLSGVTGVTAIAAGMFGGFALRGDGTVWGWGDNIAGELGTAPTLFSFVAVQIAGLSGVRSIAAGVTSAYALMANGTVDAWGQGEDGQLGNGGTASSEVPAPVHGLADVAAIGAGSWTAYALNANGSVSAWGAHAGLGDGSTTDALVPVLVSDVSQAVAVGDDPTGSGYAIVGPAALNRAPGQPPVL